MTMREIWTSGALSEFVSGYSGDCGECAELCFLHALNPSVYPLDAAHLSAITHRDIAAGWASSNGAEPLSSIARDLDTLGVKYTNCGYSEPFTVDYQHALDAYGGVRPMVFEVALAGRLSGDEIGVHYHFITCLGWDSAAQEGIFADGDNAAVRVSHLVGAAGLVRYSLAELQAAQPCGLLICDEFPPAPPVPPTPPPTGMRAYTIVSGDTLSSIAAKLHLSSWYHALYQPNMQVIEEAARAHGHPSGSDGGNLIFPTTVLHYQAA